MPNTEVSWLLDDPDIAAQTFSVIRSAVTVGTDGQATSTPTTTPVRGSVQPARSRDLQRLPQGTYQEGVIKVRTVFRLTSGGQGTAADIVQWPVGGPRYQVETVDDWTQFGAGFVSALAILMDVNP